MDIGVDDYERLTEIYFVYILRPLITKLYIKN